MHAQKLALEKEKIGGNFQLGAMKVGVDVQKAKHQTASQEKQFGIKTGVEIAKHKQEQRTAEREQMMGVAKEMVKAQVQNRPKGKE